MLLHWHHCMLLGLPMDCNYGPLLLMPYDREPDPKHGFPLMVESSELTLYVPDMVARRRAHEKLQDSGASQTSMEFKMRTQVGVTFNSDTQLLLDKAERRRAKRQAQYDGSLAGLTHKQDVILKGREQGIR